MRTPQQVPNRFNHGMPSRPRRRLRAVSPFESLEGRTLLSAFTVQNLADAGEGSLRQAVLDANASFGADTIGFADGLLGTIALTGGELNITDHLTIDGPGADLLAVSGNYQSRVFRISGGVTVSIADLSITKGRAAGDGGAILNTGSTLALDRVVLAENQAVGASGGNGRGAGVASVSGATLTVTDSLFNQNQAVGGATGGVMTFGRGGGIFALASSLTVSRSTFVANQAIGGAGGGTGQGGGIIADSSSAAVTDSTFIGNQAIGGNGSGGNGFAGGAGMYNIRGTLTVANCTVQGNLVRGGSNITFNRFVNGIAGGAGILNGDDATLFLAGSTIRDNQALGGSNNTNTGGSGDIGTAFGGGLNNVGTATVTDSLFEGNEARGGSGNRGSGIGYQFVGTGTGGGIATSARNILGAAVSLTLNNVTIRRNRAVGGDGNTGGTVMDAGIGGGLGNNGSNHFVAVSGGSEVTLQGGTVAHNQAVGGSGGAALGGGIANMLGGVATISDDTITHNHADGGVGGITGAGGNGLGGGVFNDAASTHSSNAGVPTILRVSNATLARNMALGGDGEVSGGDGFGGGLYTGGNTSIAATIIAGNHANGGDGGAGGSDGEGIGGGVYAVYAQGAFELVNLTLIRNNHASTSDDDIFGLI